MISLLFRFTVHSAFCSMSEKVLNDIERNMLGTTVRPRSYATSSKEHNHLIACCISFTAVIPILNKLCSSLDPVRGNNLLVHFLLIPSRFLVSFFNSTVDGLFTLRTPFIISFTLVIVQLSVTFCIYPSIFIFTETSLSTEDQQT